MRPSAQSLPTTGRATFDRVNFLWSIAELLRDSFKRSKYQDVILPLTVLRRADCVLQPTKERVLEVNAQYRGKLENLDPLLRRTSGFAFYNTSPYDFERLLGDAPNLAANLRNYIARFSGNMREVLEKFDFDNTVTRLDEAGLLFLALERFKNCEASRARTARRAPGGHALPGAPEVLDIHRLEHDLANLAGPRQ